MQDTRITGLDWELQRMLEVILAVRRQRGEDISFSDLLSQYNQQKQFHDDQRQQYEASEHLVSMVFKQAGNGEAQ
jgi:hypothetical protein